MTTTTTNPSAQVTYATTAFAVAVTKRLRTTLSTDLSNYLVTIWPVLTLPIPPIAEKIPATVINKHPLVVKSLMMVLSLVH